MVTRVFGPVPSRRLGRSLGINNIPPKHCSYSCIYCQLGRTTNLTIKRRKFYDPSLLVREVTEAVNKVGLNNIDYISFVPDGEPTLDVNLGRIIEGIKEKIPLPVAILTNGSLLFMEDAVKDACNADLVSLKVDTVSEKTFRAVNRPHPSLNVERVLEGMRSFAKTFSGKIITETMLVSGVNDNPEELEKIAQFIKALDPFKAYIAIPLRPPAETWVKPPSEVKLVEAYQVFSRFLSERVEMLTGFEGPRFGTGSSDPIEGLLAIVSVHPMRLDYAHRFLSEFGLDPDRVIERLISENKVVKVSYRGHEFIFRKLQ